MSELAEVLGKHDWVWVVKSTRWKGSFTSGPGSGGEFEVVCGEVGSRQNQPCICVWLQIFKLAEVGLVY